MEKEYAEYLLKKTKEDYDLIAEDFSRTRYSAWPEFGIFTDFIKEGDKILDVGCGNGRLLELLKDKKIGYTGVDVSEKLIRLAQEKYPQNNFLLADNLNLPFSDDNFDKVFSVAVLHNVPSDELRKRAISELSRVLKPGGLLFITVWYLWQKKTSWKPLLKNVFLKLIGRSKLDFNDIFIPWKDSQGKIRTQRYFHCFIKKELQKLAENAGFKIKKIGLLWRSAGFFNLFLIAEK